MAGNAGTNGVPVARHGRRRTLAERVLDVFLEHALRRRRGGRTNLDGALDRASESDPIGYVKLVLANEDFMVEQELEKATPPFDLHVSHVVALLEGGPGAIDDGGRIVPVGRGAAR